MLDREHARHLNKISNLGISQIRSCNYMFFRSKYSVYWWSKWNFTSWEAWIGKKTSAL